MAQAIGSMYHIGKVPIRLYWDSGRAAARNATGGGWVNKVGNYKIINRAWTHNGKLVFSDPGGGAIPLYAINDITNSYVIGWVRDDDNITKGTLTDVPSSLSSEASSFKIGIDKMAIASYALKIEVNGQQWVSHSGSADNYTHTMTDASKDKLYSAMWNLTNATAKVTLETFYNGQHLGTDIATINISIPASIKPTFTTPPAVSVYGAISNKNYAGIGGMRITNAPGWQPGRGATSAPYKITVTNMSGSGTNKWTFNNPGQAKLTYTIVDSRGRSTSMEWEQTVEATEPISVDSFTAKRSGSTGATFEANGRYMASVDGTPTYQISRRERGTSRWTSVESGTASVSNGRWSVSRTVPTGHISNKSYDIQILVAGTATNASAQSVIGTEAVPISFGKHGSGVGTMFNNSDSASLQVGSGGIKSEGPLRVPTFDIIDDRSLNPVPYTSGSSNRGLSVHFKNSSVIGVPDPSTYSTLFDIQPWSDSSGGNHQQLAINSQGELYGRMGTSSWSGWRKFAFTSDIPNIPTPFTKGSNTNGTWIKFSDGTIIAERKVSISYTHNEKIPNFAYNMPVSMPTDCYVGVSLRSVYTANSEAEIDIYDNFDFLVVGKRGNQWIMKPNLFNRYGSVSYGANNGNWFNTKAGTSYTMRLTFIAIGVV